MGEPSATCQPDPAREGTGDPRRFRRLPTVEVLGRRVPVATSFRARLLGLALLERGKAGEGLLIPRCRRVHTFGMRFHLDLYFLDEHHAVIAHSLSVPPRRTVHEPAARAVLELPAPACGQARDRV